MNPMQKVAIFSACASAPLLAAAAIWFGYNLVEAHQNAKFLHGFEAITHARAPMTVAQVEELMGRPASIDESQSADQTVSGMVYHYPGHGADFKIVFVNGVVFHSEMPSPTKS